MSYRERRTHYAFNGIPVDGLAARLSQVLSPTEAVSLPAPILEDGFSKQRLTEALYPRPVSATARFHVGVVPSRQR